MKVFRSTPCGARRGELLQARAEHEEEEQRLHQRGDDPDAVAAEADQLAPPDDLHRAQLAAPAARRDADADDLGRGGAGGRRPARWRSSPAPRHHLHHHPVGVLAAGLLGVADRRAGVRHEDVVERRARDADRADRRRRARRTAAARTPRPRARRRSRRPRRSSPRGRSARPARAIAASSSSVWIRTRSAPTCCLQRLGRVEGDDLALVHDRDAVAELGLVHVVRGHEDRDLLALLQLGDVAPDRAARLRVEADRRLVEEEHARRVQEAARDLQAPAHAAGEGHHRARRGAPTGRPSRAPGACGRGRARSRRRRARRAGAGSARRSGSRRASGPGRRGRCGGGRRRARRTTSWPATARAARRSACASVQSMLIVVVLPAPLGPRKPKTSPAATSKLTPRTASISSKDLRRSSTSIASVDSVTENL